MLAGDCDNRNCPKVLEDDNGDFVVQGDTVVGTESLPAGESRVRVPRALLLELASQLAGRRPEAA